VTCSRCLYAGAEDCASYLAIYLAIGDLGSGCRESEKTRNRVHVSLQRNGRVRQSRDSVRSFADGDHGSLEETAGLADYAFAHWARMKVMGLLVKLELALG
jgi:hypothetical protein